MHIPPTGSAPARGAFAAPGADGAVEATLTIPGSKSLTNRELVLAAIAEGPSRISAPLPSEDSNRMIESLRAPLRRRHRGRRRRERVRR